MFKINYKKINVIKPQPFDTVGIEFVISGYLPKSWLKDESGNFYYGLSLDFIDIECFIFMGKTLHIPESQGFWDKLLERVKFSQVVQFESLNIPFIKRAEGRIGIMIRNTECLEKSIFIPLLMPQFTNERNVNNEIIQKHKNIGKNIIRYENDLKNYNEEIMEVFKRRDKRDKIFEKEELNQYRYSYNLDIATEILNILEETEESFDTYLYSPEDGDEKKLEEKYKDALKWRGPLYHGLIAKINGFEMRVHSHDHDKHFHVIHKGKGINARFSFPEIQLLNYVNHETTIRKKEEDKIREFCLQPDILKKLEDEFKKRDQ